MNDFVTAYLTTWNSPAAERDTLIAAHFSPEVTYTDPLAAVSGHGGLSAVISGVQEQFPGFVFTQVGDVNAHHQQGRFQWGLGPEGAEPVVIGFDVVVLDDDGRIRDVRGFLDKVPA